VFRLASLTKPIVSTAAMILIERGQLALDDLVTRWLPAFRPALPNGERPPITVRQLLSIVTDRLKLRLRTLAAEQGVGEAEAASAMTRASRVTRFGEPIEIARAVAFLASPQADYIQGALLDIYGGQTRTL
jgi:hypothetical protein